MKKLANISGILGAIEGYKKEIEDNNEVTVLYGLKTGLENNVYISDGRKQKLIYLLNQKIKRFVPYHNGIHCINNICYCIL